MKRRAAAAAAALALITGGGVLAGCGSEAAPDTATAASTVAEAPPNGVETLSGQEILDKSLAATSAASSVTVSGSLTQDGQAVALALTVGTDAAGGTIKAEGLEVDLRVVGGKSYFKMSGEALAKVMGEKDSPGVVKAVSALIGDKWLVMPVDSAGDFEGLNQLAQKDTLFKDLLMSNGKITVTGTGDVNGVPVVFLESADGKGTLAIQTVGEPYPVQIKGPGSDVISFTAWNAPVSVTAPTDVIDIGALAALGDAN